MFKIAVTSDTHGSHWNIALKERVDLFIHAGDAAGADSNHKTASDFMEWLDSQPAREKLFVPGNHDGFFSRPGWEAVVPAGVHVLTEGMLKLFGGELKICGSAFTPEFCGWDFMKPRERLIQDWRKAAPLIIDQIGRPDIMVCHGPPYGILDLNSEGENCGCEGLLEAILAIKPRLGLFGHIHEAQGQIVMQHGSLLANVSYMNEHYRPTGKVFTISM